MTRAPARKPRVAHPESILTELIDIEENTIAAAGGIGGYTPNWGDKTTNVPAQVIRAGSGYYVIEGRRFIQHFFTIRVLVSVAITIVNRIEFDTNKLRIQSISVGGCFKTIDCILKDPEDIAGDIPAISESLTPFWTALRAALTTAEIRNATFEDEAYDAIPVTVLSPMEETPASYSKTAYELANIRIMFRTWATSANDASEITTLIIRTLQPEISEIHRATKFVSNILSSKQASGGAITNLYLSELILDFTVQRKKE